METYQIIAFIIAIILIISLGVLVFFLKKKKEIKSLEEFPELLMALGGKENIISVDHKGSRVSVVVENKKNVDREKVREQGVTIVISNKKVTMVVDAKKSILMFNYLNAQINL